MNKKVSARQITLEDLWQIFVQRWVWLLLVAALFTAGLFVYHKITFVPKYQSTATLYLLRQESPGDRNTSLVSDFSIGLNVVNDCTHMLKSRQVVDQTIEKLRLNTTYETLSRNISTYSPEESRVLQVRVVADTQKEAQRIVNKLCEIGQEEISRVMGFQQIRLFEYGTLDEKPCNAKGISTFARYGLLMAILVYFLFLLLFLLDDKLYTEEEIERYLGLSVLGDIPNVNNAKKKKGYYRYERYGGEKAKEGN